VPLPLRFIGIEWRPAQDSIYTSGMRRHVVQALVEQTEPDTRSAALIALLHMTRCEPKIVDGGHNWPNRLVARGEEISNGSWAPDTIRNSIDTVIHATKEAALATQ
jgi:hypothetical protein